MLKSPGRLVLLALAAATAYEIVDGLGGGNWRELGWADMVGVISLLATAGIALVYASVGDVPRVSALLAPAVGAYLLAFSFSYDPYFGGAVRRYSQSYPWAPTWIFGIAAATVALGIFTRRYPRVGSAVTALLPLVSLATIAVLGND